MVLDLKLKATAQYWSGIMSRLPRDLQLEIVKRLDIDDGRALGVPPGKLRVPPAVVARLEAIPRKHHYGSTSGVNLGVEPMGNGYIAKYVLYVSHAFEWTLRIRWTQRSHTGALTVAYLNTDDTGRYQVTEFAYYD